MPSCRFLSALLLACALMVAGVPCATGTVALNSLVLRLEPPIAYDFMIVVHQPDGSVLTRQIFGE